MQQRLMQMIQDKCYNVDTEKMIQFEALNANEGGDPYKRSVGVESLDL